MWQQLDRKLPVWRTQSVWSKCWDVPLPRALQSSESVSGICARTPWRGAWRSSWRRHGSWEGKAPLFSITMSNQTPHDRQTTKSQNNQNAVFQCSYPLRPNKPITELLREYGFFIELGFYPVHQVLHVLWCRHLDWPLDLGSISPPILVTTGIISFSSDSLQCDTSLHEHDRFLYD